MKQIIMNRNKHNQFVAHDYTAVRGPGSPAWQPRICAGATTRIFKLTPGTTRVSAVFTKTPPRKKCAKYYQLTRRRYLSCSRAYTDRIDLLGFRGHFLVGVATTLRDMYKLGYRYVRVEEA